MTMGLKSLLGTSAIALGLLASAASAQTELRITWYNDGNEGEVMQTLIDRFEASNPEISVTLDVVPYSAILESLPVQLVAGDGPDIARVTDLGGLSEHNLEERLINQLGCAELLA